MLILARQAQIIDPNRPHHGTRQDVLIKDGKIEAISPALEVSDAQIIESDDLHVSLGWVDIGLQVADPGYEHREDVTTASKAAARGGFTAIAPFPNTNPVIDSKTALNYWRNQSRMHLVDILPIGAITCNCNGKDITEMIDMHQGGAIAFSDGDHPIQDNGMMMRALQYVRAFEGIVINRPYDLALAGGGHINEGFTSTVMGMKGIAPLAEEMMIIRDINLAIYADSKVHIHGISTAGSVALIRKAKQDGVAVSCSVPALNLAFEDKAVENFDAQFKVLPPLRTARDKAALKAGLEDGTIDMIISNHTPWEEEKKKLEFAYAEFGAIGLETCYGIVNTETKLSQELIIEKIAIQPRQIFNQSRPGIQVGQSADLCFFDPQKEWVVDSKT
ncbi:MAG: dihydroorotase, partial [Bacteroidota bacterium]